MMPVIRQGDALHPFGGEVLEGRFDAFGKPLAFVGAAARCSKHGLTQVAKGSAVAWLDGAGVALHGHPCTCGCTLVSSLAAELMQVAP